MTHQFIDEETAREIRNQNAIMNAEEKSLREPGEHVLNPFAPPVVTDENWDWGVDK